MRGVSRAFLIGHWHLREAVKAAQCPRAGTPHRHWHTFLALLKELLRGVKYLCLLVYLYY